MIKTCPGGCGSPKEDLYEGFNVVECPNRGCSHHSEKQESIVKERYAELKRQNELAFEKKKRDQDETVKIKTNKSNQSFTNLIDEEFNETYLYKDCGDGLDSEGFELIKSSISGDEEEDSY